MVPESQGQDDGGRGRWGVAISIRQDEPNSFRVIIDDIIRVVDEPWPTWSTRGVVTWGSITGDEFLSPDKMSKKQLENFGFTVLSRLAAQWETQTDEK